MTEEIGWLVVQREVSQSVRVTGVAEVWLTAVFATPSRTVVGVSVAGAAAESLEAALAQAVEAPARGAPTQPPSLVLAPAALVDLVGSRLHHAGIAVPVEETEPADWADDVVTELVGHAAGRRQAADPPLPEE